MSEMIERVVKAMRETGLDCCTWGDEVMAELATAAITAMREPTDAMVNALDDGDEDHGLEHGWRAAIDAALAD
jgi:hypothetical protein